MNEYIHTSFGVIWGAFAFLFRLWFFDEKGGGSFRLSFTSDAGGPCIFFTSTHIRHNMIHTYNVCPSFFMYQSNVLKTEYWHLYHAACFCMCLVFRVLFLSFVSFVCWFHSLVYTYKSDG